MKNFFQRYFITIFIIFVICLAVVIGIFYKNDVSYLNPDFKTETEIKDLASKVGEIILLPEGEVPTVMTVSDPKLLKEQVFFQNAKKGYKVLIYSNVGKAFLYDPIAHKIIEVGRANVGDLKKSITTSNDGEVPQNQF